MGVMRSSWQKKMEIMGAKEFVVLETLVTVPEERGRGAAKLLLQEVMEFARERGKEIYVSSTPDGVPLYRKFGFIGKDRFEIDISKVSAEERWNCCMVLPVPEGEAGEGS